MEQPSVSFLLLVIASSLYGIGFGKNGTFNVLDFGATGKHTAEDTQAFLNAWERMCGTEGAIHVLKIPPGKTYQLKPLKFKGPCKADTVKIQILGNIEAPSSLSDWNGCQSGCWLCFSNVRNLAVVGTGQINGHGYLWWRHKPAQAIDYSKVTNYEGCNAPTAIHFDQCDNLKLSGFSSIDSPRNHIQMHRCNDVYISNIHITAPEDSPNTDGIAISSTSHVKVLDSVIETGDDCISIKGGSSFINVTSVACGPGHGISVGSLGEHGADDKVENVHVQNCTFNRAQNGARIKTWQGGSGYARAITFEQITLSETKHPIIIDQNYMAGDNRGVKVSDITFSGFLGTSASEQAITLNCCTLRCTNIVMDHVNLTSMVPRKPLTSLCKNANGRSISTVPNVDCLSK